MTWRERLAKAAEQLGLFGRKPAAVSALREEVKQPGSRGGVFYHSKQGHVRYGRPTAKWFSSLSIPTALPAPAGWKHEKVDLSVFSPVFARVASGAQKTSTVGELIANPRLRKLYANALDTTVYGVPHKDYAKIFDGSTAAVFTPTKTHPEGLIVLHTGFDLISRKHTAYALLHEAAHALRKKKGRHMESSWETPGEKDDDDVYAEWSRIPSEVTAQQMVRHAITVKAIEQQLGLFGAPRQEVQQPGIRGGKYYMTETGHVKYGERPLPHVSHVAPLREQAAPPSLPPPPPPPPPSSTGGSTNSGGDAGGGGGAESPPAGEPEAPPEAWVPGFKLEGLEAEVARLNRRAKRLGLKPIEIERLGTEMRREVRIFHNEQRGMDVVSIEEVHYRRPDDKKTDNETGRIVEFHHLRLHGETPKLPGWTFRAVIEHGDEDIGNIVNTIGDVPIPTEFRHAPATCDHCHTARDRLKTYVVQHDNGEFKRVGSNCIADFLGHGSAAALIAIAEMAADMFRLLNEFSDEEGYSMGGLGGRADGYTLKTFLTLAAAEIRKYGFYARSHPDVKYGNKASTGASVSMSLDDIGKGKANWEQFRVLPEDENLAARVTEWAQALYEDEEKTKGNDYLWNLALLAKRGFIASKHTGYAASMIQAYQREIEQLERVAWEKKTSNYVGEVGQRHDFKNVKVERIIPNEGIYGTTYIHRMRDPDGNVLMWFASGTQLESGLHYDITARVKKHDAYREVKQTIIQRPNATVVREPESTRWREWVFSNHPLAFTSLISQAYRDAYAAHVDSERPAEPPEHLQYGGWIPPPDKKKSLAAMKAAVKSATSLHEELTAAERTDFAAWAEGRARDVASNWFGDYSDAKAVEIKAELEDTIQRRVDQLRAFAVKESSIAKALAWIVAKAEQLGFGFAPRQEVQQPGIRGGRYRVTDKGQIRYDQPPVAHVAIRPPAPPSKRPQLALIAVGPQPDPKLADKFRRLADAMTDVIQSKFDPGVSHQNVTARRARIAEGMFQQGEYLESIQSVLYGMAEEADEGKLPELLRGITTRAHVEDILSHKELPHPYLHSSTLDDVVKFARRVMPSSPLTAVAEKLKGGGPKSGSTEIPATAVEYEAVDRLALELLKQKDTFPQRWEDGSWSHSDVYGAERLREGLASWRRISKTGLDTGEKWNEARAHLQAMRKSSHSVDKELRQMENALIGRKIPGYFPTPKTTGEKIVEMADIEPGMTVLEPSAGKGNLCDVIREKHPDAPLACYEVNTDLQAVLRHKGHNVLGFDFLGAGDEQYDRIVMNPPFEHLQDAQHVRHAYEHNLKPGGRLVSIMGEHCFFAEDSGSREFRAWLESVGGIAEQLPSKSFMSSERPTGVNTRVVVVDKPEAAAEMPMPLARFEYVRTRADAAAPDAGQVWNVRDDGPEYGGWMMQLRGEGRGLSVWRKMSDFEPDPEGEERERAVVRASTERMLNDEERELRRRYERVTGQPLPSAWVPPAISAELSQTRSGEADKIEARLAAIQDERRSLYKSQLGFGFAQEVQAPGSRGGHYRLTDTGHVRYDRPAPATPAQLEHSGREYQMGKIVWGIMRGMTRFEANTDNYNEALDRFRDAGLDLSRAVPMLIEIADKNLEHAPTEAIEARIAHYEKKIDRNVAGWMRNIRSVNTFGNESHRAAKSRLEAELDRRKEKARPKGLFALPLDGEPTPDEIEQVTPFVKVGHNNRGWWLTAHPGDGSPIEVAGASGPFLTKQDAIRQGVNMRRHRDWREGGYPIREGKTYTTLDSRSLWKGEGTNGATLVHPELDPMIAAVLASPGGALAFAVRWYFTQHPEKFRQQDMAWLLDAESHMTGALHEAGFPVLQGGLMVPPKSACWFCGAMHADEIYDLYMRHPEIYAAAEGIENVFHHVTPWRELLLKEMARKRAAGNVCSSCHGCSGCQLKLPELTEEDARALHGAVVTRMCERGEAIQGPMLIPPARPMIKAKVGPFASNEARRREHLLRERSMIEKELFYLLDEDLPAADDILRPQLDRRAAHLKRRKNELSSELDQQAAGGF